MPMINLEEGSMERRLFLTGMLGAAGVVAFASVAGPGRAVAGIPQGNGILDVLDKPDPAVSEGDDEAGLEQVSHRRWHRYGEWRHDRRWRRRHGRRRVWRRVCRRTWRHGRRHVRCWRERVWARVWL
ncbi:protamine-2 (modular protein) [Mesorhizobium sp. B2-4-17]|uniref:protamine-2 (modular protein) n=1 Tax=Mesorhizobium sp. B2-4-17 TaxID=2589932 RepID=UPI001FEE27C6|nr:protamine-2 (modular protein) [Mesorhizobium sp. B2-4-17]